ncbi:MAG: helix-turn-helix transcriptional regulator [Candidatus Cybelea sp.]
MKNAEPHRELFVLGLLRRQALSAYAVDQIMREHFPLYRRFRRGNIYQLVERLREDGYLLQRSAATRRGPRESKAVYRLSSAGEARFHELLHGVITDVQSSDPALETAFVLLGQLRRDEALALMLERMREIESQERRLKRLFGDARGRGGAGYFAAAHAYHRMRSEHRFLEDAVRRLRDRTWEPKWVLDDGPIP